VVEENRVKKSTDARNEKHVKNVEKLAENGEEDGEKRVDFE